MPDMKKRGYVSDEFRERRVGDVLVPMNSKPATDNFHIDRSRIGTHDEWSETAPNDWGGKGNVVKVKNSIMDQTRASMGDLHHPSSSYDVNQASKADAGNIPSMPSPFFSSSRLRRGD